jgi:hypothetical protein
VIEKNYFKKVKKVLCSHNIIMTMSTPSGMKRALIVAKQRIPVIPPALIAAMIAGRMN